MTWLPEDFEIATPRGPETVAGYTYGGLGLHANGYKRWSLTHLMTGHAVVKELRGDVKTVFPIATEIADLMDWDFSTFQGSKNRDPDIRRKVEEICAAHPKIATFGEHHDCGNAEVARQISDRREARRTP